MKRRGETERAEAGIAGSGSRQRRRRRKGYCIFYPWSKEDGVETVQKRRLGRRRRRGRCQKILYANSLGASPWDPGGIRGGLTGRLAWKEEDDQREEVGEDRHSLSHPPHLCVSLLGPTLSVYISRFSFSTPKEDRRCCRLLVFFVLPSARFGQGPPNKRSVRSRAARLEWTSKKRRDHGVPSLSASETKPSGHAFRRRSCDSACLSVAFRSYSRRNSESRNRKERV